MIAIAIAAGPSLLIADEPSTALDVTLQAQILELLKALQRERGMALLFITHDLGVVAQIADRVAVMYAGHIVETGARAAFFQSPAHPYSRKLFAAVPSTGKRGRVLAVIPGSVPALWCEFPGCRFASRCDSAWDTCRTVPPEMLPLAPDQAARCHLHDPRYRGARAAPSGPPVGPIGDADAHPLDGVGTAARGRGCARPFPDPQGSSPRHRGLCARRRWGLAHHCPRHHAGARGRIRVREDHDGEGDPAASSRPPPARCASRART